MYVAWLFGVISGFPFLRYFGSVVDPLGSPGATILCLCRVLISDVSYVLSVICLFPVLIHCWINKLKPVFYFLKKTKVDLSFNVE